MDRRQDTITDYKCPVCGNTDARSIGILNGKLYCRRCIYFRGDGAKYTYSFPKETPIYLS